VVNVVKVIWARPAKRIELPILGRWEGCSLNGAVWGSRPSPHSPFPHNYCKTNNLEVVKDRVSVLHHHPGPSPQSQSPFAMEPVAFAMSGCNSARRSAGRCLLPRLVGGVRNRLACKPEKFLHQVELGLSFPGVRRDLELVQNVPLGYSATRI
jgi:hypothetical protein